MLRDRIFYPLIILVALGMIAFALSFGSTTSITDEEIVDEGWEISGPDLVGLTISPGSSGRYINEEGGYLRLSQFTPFGQGPASPGVFATLGPDHERVFSGQRLRITYHARATRDNPLDKFDGNYYPMEANPSPTYEFELGSDWQAFSFEFTPPIVDAPENVDLIALFPGRTGEQMEMDLAAITVEVLGEAQSGDEA